MKGGQTRAPEGWFAEGLILYGALEPGAVAARGYVLTPPDLRGASNERRNAFHDRVRALLALLQSDQRLQVQWSCHADYRRPLADYRSTESRDGKPANAARAERCARYEQRMRSRGLRREHLVIFLTIEVRDYAGNFAGPGGLREHYAQVLRQLRVRFDEFGHQLAATFGGETAVQAMDDADHFAFVQGFLNPSLAGRSDYEPAAQFDPQRSLQELCWCGDGVARAAGGFYLDGHCHAVLTLKRWPRRTHPGIITHLTGLPLLDYAVTVNVTPLPSAEEVRSEERAMERLEGEYAQQRRPSLLVALRKKERKVENLATGTVQPFNVQYVVRAWNPTEEGLRHKVAALKAAIHGMDGADYYDNALPATARKLFFATWPGWTQSGYRHRDLYAEDRYLADLLPISATFTGHLADAEALYDGAHGNLVGVRTFVGGSPQHAVLVGMTGAGKSLFMRDLLEQTAPYFGYTVIIEEGLSYKEFTEGQGERPIVVHPDGELTLNYLDTQGLPLTQLHLASATALLGRMIGELSDPERAQLRSAQLAHYVNRLYRVAYERWSRRCPEAAAEARRVACALPRWQQAAMPAGTPALDVFSDLRAQLAAGSAAARECVESMSEFEAERFAQEPATAALAWNTAFAFFRPEDFPTHAELVALLGRERAPGHPAEEIDRLATLLGAWTANGPYGRLFDGVTNVSLQRRVVHFELGLIPEQATELKTAAGLLITGFARQHVLALPRAVRKRIIFEEVARFLDVPGGEKIVAESYAQLRKFNCWAISIVQQYARFQQARLRPVVMGNAKQFFLLRQGDRADLEALAHDIGLPESTFEAIQRYPLPEQLPAGARYSSICYFAPAAEPPFCGTLRHIPASP
jgi:hypothetical protein